jgi:LTXXQ motif family protein
VGCCCKSLGNGLDQPADRSISISLALRGLVRAIGWVISDFAASPLHNPSLHLTLGELDLDARVAALKAGLELTPEQEKNWPAVEAAIRDMAKARADRMAARANEQPPSDPVERLHRRAERLGTVAAGLKKLADAEEPLYKSLDDAQKQRFKILMRALKPHHHMGFAGWQKRGWSGHDGRGQEPGDSHGDSMSGSNREL